MQDPIDRADLKTLSIAILRQCLDDYTKLQHPRFRKKKYLIEAYQNAVDMLFDKDYRMLYIKNEDGEDMSLEDLLRVATNSENPDAQRLKDYIIRETLEFWNTKEIRVLEIPDTLQINGHVYFIEHTDNTDTADVDHDEKVVTMNKHDSSENQEQLIIAAMQATLHHEGIDLDPQEINNLGRAWFRTLKLNNCFVGAD